MNYIEPHFATLAWAAAVAVCLALHAAYCGLEMGVYTINKVRLDLHAESGVGPARLLRRMLRNPRNLLAVILIGTNITAYVVTFGLTAIMEQNGYARQAEWLVTVVAAPALFVFGDSLPKAFFHRMGCTAAYRLAWVLRWSDLLFKLTGLSPLVRGITGGLMRLTRAGRRQTPAPGLAAIVAEGQASGLLTHSQSVMADRVARIGHVTLKDVMTPMAKVVSAPADVGAEQVRRLLAEHNFSRIPLLAGDGQVAGILDIYDAADDMATPPQPARPLVLHSSATVTDSLYRMQREHATMAVVERDGRHVGIVTIKDLVEEIVGALDAW